jgi:hypothetical protein
MKIHKFIIAMPLIFIGGWIALLALYVVVLLGAGAVGYVRESIFGSPKDHQLMTHLTIYVDNPALQDGAGVLVAGISIDEEKWRELENTNSIAMLNPNNPKAKEVKAGDKHFGAIVSSPASAVEIYYPKNGSYTFNFLPYPNAQGNVKELKTEVLSGGGRSQLPDPETGKLINWPSEVTVAVFGKKYSLSWAKTVESSFFASDDEEKNKIYKINKFSGVRVIEITPLGIEKILERTKG